MRYVSIDIETSGLNPDKDFILEFAAVADDGEGDIGELATFSRVLKWERISGEIFALNMNRDIITEMLGRDAIHPGLLMTEFRQWLRLVGYADDEKLVLAGKNVAGFDIPFLKHLPGWVPHFHRVLDPGTLWVEPTIDVKPPDLATCLQRAGIDEHITHRALGDAMAVVKCLRAGWERHQQVHML